MRQSPDTDILVTEVLLLFSSDGPCSSSAIRHVISIFPVGTREYIFPLDMMVLYALNVFPSI